MWWFIDNNGNFQLTGVGLLMMVFFTVIIALIVVDIVKKFFFYRAGYYALKKELEEARVEVEKNLPLHLERYYQSRKKWEKRNLFW